MKKFLLLFLTSLICAPALQASGLDFEFKPYAALRGGYEWSKQKYDAPLSGGADIKGYLFKTSGIAVNPAFGAWFNSYLRAEISYTYKNIKDNDYFDMSDFFSNTPFTDTHGSKKTTTHQHTVLFNVFIHPFKNLAVNPFIGAGLGYGFMKIKNDLENRDPDNFSGGNFAYAFYIGADYNVSQNFALEITGTYNVIARPYRGDDMFTENYPQNVKNFGAYIGLRYKL